jgi:hypothetical protein
MAGTDSTFSASGSEQSNTSVGTVINKDGQNAGMGNANGDQVDNSAGANTLITDGFNGTFGQSPKIYSVQYNPAALYPNS